MNPTDLRKNFNLENTILTNFVFLTDQEKEMVRNWRNNPDIRKWMYTDHYITPEEHRSFIENLKNENKNFYWVVKSKREDYLGVVSVNRVDLGHKVSYLGMYVSPDNQVAGSGQLLMGSLQELVFNVANLDTLKLEVFSANERAINFYKRTGFSAEQELKGFIFKNEKWHDVLVMGMGRAAFSNLKVV